MTTADEPHEGMTFLKALFGPSTTQSVYLCSLPNEKGEAGAGERAIADRDETVLPSFSNRWGRDGGGLSFFVSTLLAGTRRNRENVLEVPALHVDIDFKSIKQNEEDAKAIVRGLVRLPPSAVVYSGHGLHAYWILKEALDAQENLDRVEGVLRQLADTFGGDLQVTHVAALMRLPGSHNTKGGQWWEGKYDLVERRYELEDVEEWLAEQSPVLTRKERPPKPPENPYLAIARTLMFKPALDVEERLSAMSYQGEGDASIHATQLAVSSSILSRGGDIDTVVEILLAATRAAAGEYGTRWNWAAEERNIRKMGATWLSKLAKKEALSNPQNPQNPQTQTAPAPIVDIGQAREARASKAKPAAQPKPATTSVAGKKFHLVAAATIAVLRQRGGDLLFEHGQCWRYTDRLWHLEAEAKGWLNAEIEQAARGLGIVSDNRLVNEARGWIERNPDLARPGGWDEHGLVPTKSGLFDPRSGELVPAEPAHRVTWRVDAEYVPGAACPHWLQMLADAFADRPPAQRAAVIGTLQECLGAALIDVKPRGLRKALIFVGGTSSGKSQLLAVLGGMFGTGRIAQAIAAVDTPHGLMQFQRRAPWILDEAFNQSVWNLSATVKTLITGEAVPINVKHGPLIHHHFLGPIF